MSIASRPRATLPIAVLVPALALACVRAFALASRLAGTMRDAGGHPVADAVVVGTSDTEVTDASGLKHRWITTSDAAGRFALDDFPAGACHVTANAGATGVGQERDGCAVSGDAAAGDTVIVVAPPTQHVCGHVRRAGTGAQSPGDYVLVARTPAGEDGPLVMYGARIERDAWQLDLPPGGWMAKGITPTRATDSLQFALPGRTTPIELDLDPPRGSHPALTRELHAMVVRDQAVRQAAIAAGFQDKAALAAMERVDRANLARLRQMIRQHGWPSAASVGTQGMQDAWVLIQHGPQSFIARSLPHLKAAADRGEIAWSALALTVDRDLHYRHQPQLYGSQGNIDRDGHFVLFEVEDPAHLDERRASVGLGPIADYQALVEKEFRPADARR